MKALTLTQPWAGIVASGIKRLENRPWKPPAKLIGQRFAIHASRQVDELVIAELLELAGEPPDDPGLDYSDVVESPLWRITGSVIAVATLDGFIDCVEATAFEDGLDDQTKWWTGPIAFVLKDIKVVTPIAAKGALSFWQLPDDITARLAAELGEDLR